MLVGNRTSKRLNTVNLSLKKPECRRQNVAHTWHQIVQSRFSGFASLARGNTLTILSSVSAGKGTPQLVYSQKQAETRQGGGAVQRPQPALSHAPLRQRDVRFAQHCASDLIPHFGRTLLDASRLRIFHLTTSSCITLRGPASERIMLINCTHPDDMQVLVGRSLGIGVTVGFVCGGILVSLFFIAYRSSYIRNLIFKRIAKKKKPESIGSKNKNMVASHTSNQPEQETQRYLTGFLLASPILVIVCLLFLLSLYLNTLLSAILIPRLISEIVLL
ncbi:hypothetical protein O3P69_020585 [Scylla paramamosain]|uniref:Uncharacterized protein n=1 Tax=Scylla paramamosain TaxID=85552 RepID=A0AAW0TMW7_SCYPA